VGAPARTGPERLDEGVLGAILGGFGVGKDRREGAEDAWVSGLVEAVEVVLRAGLVCVGRHGGYNGAGYIVGCSEHGGEGGAGGRLATQAGVGAERRLGRGRGERGLGDARRR